jgi:hypothetical protein
MAGAHERRNHVLTTLESKSNPTFHPRISRHASHKMHGWSPLVIPPKLLFYGRTGQTCMECLPDNAHALKRARRNGSIPRYHCCKNSTPENPSYEALLLLDSSKQPRTVSHHLMRHLRSLFQHYCNPLHVYCRLREMGVTPHMALRMCSVYERFLFRKSRG